MKRRRDTRCSFAGHTPDAKTDVVEVEGTDDTLWTARFALRVAQAGRQIGGDIDNDPVTQGLYLLVGRSF